MALTKPRAYQIYDLDYKQAVRVISTTNVTLSGGAPATVDEVSLSDADRILVTGQIDQRENGIYFVDNLGTGSNGTWTRSGDANSNGEMQSGMIVMVTEGETYADTQWKLTTNGEIVLGTTEIVFALNAVSIIGGSNTQVQYNAGGVLAGSENLTFDGTTLSLNTASATGNITANYFLGNGSQLTGISITPSKIFNGNSEANIGTSGGNANISIGGTTNVVVFSSTNTTFAGNLFPSANITYDLGSTNARWRDLWLSNSTIYLGGATIASEGNNITINGSVALTDNSDFPFSTTGNITSGNIDTSGRITASGAITGSSLSTSGTISATGNITGGNVSATNLTGTLLTATQTNITSVGTLSSVSVSGNVQGGNILTAGIVSATGNISANYFIGNGAALTGISAGGITWTTQANTAPSSPNPGDFWYDSFADIKYQYINDGTSNVWVDQSSPTTFSTITVQNIQNGGANGTGNIGTAGNYFNTAFIKATSAQYADLAEVYESDDEYAPGTVVVFGGNKEVTVTDQSHDTRVAGVISTAPAFIMNANGAGQPVAFTGRVPCRVQGPVSKGDVLVTSAIRGVAQRINQPYQPGCVLGKSLGDISDNSVKTIEVVVGRF